MMRHALFPRWSTTLQNVLEVASEFNQ